MMTRDTIKKISEKYHGLIHISVGVFVWVVYGANWNFLIPFLVGAYLPDADHLLYIYGYGRNRPYAVKLKKALKEGGVSGVLSFIKKNHKDNTEIWSHNLLVVMMSLVFSFVFLFWGSIFWSGFFMCVFGHFIFDICEDWLFFDKLNPNWYLKFGETRS